MNRRQFIQTTSMASTSLILADHGLFASTGTRLNFILILTDDQGWGDMGCAGHRVLQTPTLDAFAEKSCRLTDLYVCSPVCAPSRAGLMTGRDPNRFQMKFLCHNGQYDAPVFHHVPLGEPMFSRQLLQAGYRTAHIGKWHLSIPGQYQEPTPADYGFQHYLIQPPEGRGMYQNPTDWNRNGNIVNGKLAEWAPDLYVDETIRFIDEHPDQPFFVNLWTFTPHEDVVCAPQFKEMYSGLSDREQTYYGAITQQDEAFGRLFRFLEEKELVENTVIVFASDNGPEHPLLPWVKNSTGSTGPFGGCKGTLKEGGIRVPGIIYWPGLTSPGSVCSLPVSTLDLFPTICSAAGCVLPERTMDGGDLRSVFTGQPVHRPHPLYWQYDKAVEHNLESGLPLALREGPWKLLCDADFKQIQLYNLDFDQGEKWNLFSEFPLVAGTMIEQVRKIYSEIQSEAKKADGFLNPFMPFPNKEPLRLG